MSICEPAGHAPGSARPGLGAAAATDAARLWVEGSPAAALAAGALMFGEACAVARRGGVARARQIMREASALLIERDLWSDAVDELHAACQRQIAGYRTSASAEEEWRF
jgi:hypothetical protein